MKFAIYDIYPEITACSTEENRHKICMRIVCFKIKRLVTACYFYV